MATYKLEIKREFGQLHLRMFANADAPPAFIGPVKDLTALVEALNSNLDERKVSNADTIIFRQIGYTDRGDLREAVRTATY